MSDTIQVVCEDGASRAFHAGHIKNQRRHGHVFVGRTRVYGSIALHGDDRKFEATGKHAHLTQSAVVEESAPLNVVEQIADATGEPSTEAHAEVLDTITDDPFARRVAVS